MNEQSGGPLSPSLPYTLENFTLFPIVFLYRGSNSTVHKNKLRHIYPSGDDTQPLLYSQIIDLVLIFYDVLVTRPLYNLYAHAFELPGHTSSTEKKSWLRIGKDTIEDPMRPNGVASDDL